MLSLISETQQHKLKARHSFHYQDIDLGYHDIGSEANQCLMSGAAVAEDGQVTRSTSTDSLEAIVFDKTISWHVRNCCALTGRKHLSRDDMAKHAILTWRLQRPYLIYCVCCSIATLFLLGWNCYKGVQNHWNLPQWKHNRWEEIMEVALGACMTVETALTLWVLGARTFFKDCSCVFDFGVMLLTVVSISYGLEHLGRKGEITEADVPLLCLRFVLQPARVLAVCSAARRTREMQHEVDELPIDFSVLPAGGSSREFLSVS